MRFSVLSDLFLFSRSFPTFSDNQLPLKSLFLAVNNGISGCLQFLGTLSACQRGWLCFSRIWLVPRLAGLSLSIFFSRQFFCSAVSPSNQATFMAAHISIPADLISFRRMKKEKRRKTHCQRRKAQEPKQKDISSGQKACPKCTVTFECFVAKDFCSRIFLEFNRFSYGKTIFKN